MKNENSSLREAWERLRAEVARANPAITTLKENIRVPTVLSLTTRVEQEKEFREAIDESCRRWIETGEWPAMDQGLACLVWDRLIEVYVFADLLQVSGFLAPELNARQVLEFLLVESWEAVGLCRLRSHLQE